MERYGHNHKHTYRKQHAFHQPDAQITVEILTDSKNSMIPECGLTLSNKNWKTYNKVICELNKTCLYKNIKSHQRKDCAWPSNDLTVTIYSFHNFIYTEKVVRTQNATRNLSWRTNKYDRGVEEYWINQRQKKKTKWKKHVKNILNSIKTASTRHI